MLILSLLDYTIRSKSPFFSFSTRDPLKLVGRTISLSILDTSMFPQMNKRRDRENEKNVLAVKINYEWTTCWQTQPLRSTEQHRTFFYFSLLMLSFGTTWQKEYPKKKSWNDDQIDDESELQRIISILRRRRCCSGIAWRERHTRHLSDQLFF